MRTIRLFVIALALAASTARAEEARLVILHTSDLHGSLLPYDDLALRRANRGLVRIATLVDTVRASGLPVLLLDAGDTIEGSGLETVHQLADTTSPDPMIAAMNHMGYDAMAVGNHEFDFGRRAFQRALAEAHFPWLAANIVRAQPGPAPVIAAVDTSIAHAPVDSAQALFSGTAPAARDSATALHAVPAPAARDSSRTTPRAVPSPSHAGHAAADTSKTHAGADTSHAHAAADTAHALPQHVPPSRSWIEPSLVKLVGGVKVGVVGLTTPATALMADSAAIAGLRFVSPLDAARGEVTRLRTQEHCGLVVLLAHTGLERDTAAVTASARTGGVYAAPAPDENWGYRLATQVPGVDVVILGHTHTVIGRDLGAVTVAQAGRWGEGLGRIDLTLSRGRDTEPWAITKRSTSFVPVRTETPDQAALAQIVTPYRDSAQRIFNRVAGRCTSPVSAPGGRLADNALWELIHRAQLQASGAEVSLAALFDPDAAIPEGPVTVRQVMRVYPYQNMLGSVRLSGAQLRDVLEHAASMLAAYDYKPGASLWTDGASPANFDGAKGITYEIDLARPAGQRVINLRRRGRPISDSESLVVVTNSYRLGGGGGYPWLATAPRVWTSSRRALELLASYVQRNQLTGTSFAPAWRVLPEFVSMPERPLIERLIARGVVPKQTAHDLRASEKARRGDIAYWIAHAFDWREEQPNSYPDVPDSLAPWVDGLVRHKVLGDQVLTEGLHPFEVLSLREGLDWCERTARRAGYTIAPNSDPSFRRSLLHRMTDIPPNTQRDSLSHAQVLGLVANLRYPEVRVLETTDFHGAILGGSRDRRSGRAVGGSPVLAAWVAKLTAENPEGTVLVDGGDCFQGTMISNLQFGKPVVEQMNAMRYTAGAIGNHEFDWSADTLERRVRSMNFSELGANMIELKTKRRPRWVKADTVVNRRGVRVGILGLCYRYTPTVTLAKHVAHLRFDDDSTTAARLVPDLARRSDIVIGIGHIPAESDSNGGARSGDLPRLARGIPGVSAWFGGHSHNQVNDRINGVPVMIAGSHGEYVAVCDLVVDPLTHRTLESRTALVRTWADEVTPDSVMAARVAHWNAEVAPIASARIGANARPLRRNRGGESTVGNLVADAMREAAQVDIALQNSGGLRADLDTGIVTRGSIYEIMPFDNQVFTMGLTGREVRLALEEALRSGRATQVSGIRYSFDPSRPAMDRVVTLTDAKGAPLDSARVYKVAVNDFMATGGDNYDVLAGGLDRTNTQILVREALEKFVAARCVNGPLDYPGDGRVQRVGGRTSSGEN